MAKGKLVKIYTFDFFKPGLLKFRFGSNEYLRKAYFKIKKKKNEFQHSLKILIHF